MVTWSWLDQDIQIELWNPADLDDLHGTIAVADRKLFDESQRRLRPPITRLVDAKEVVPVAPHNWH